MGKFLEYWKMAYFNIRMNKVRAFLTMLGIIIGIASVVGILSIGNGFSNWVSGSLNGLIGSYFQIYSNGDRAVPREVIERMVDKYPEMTGYTEDIGITGYVVSMKGEELETLISAGTPERQVSNKNELLYGREYDQNDYDNASNVVVIDTYAAKKIFGRENAVGEILHFQHRRRGEVNLKVIGVRKSTRQDNEKKKDTVGEDGADNQLIVVMQDERLQMEMPSTVLYRMYSDLLDPNELSSVIVFVDEPAHVAEMCQKGRRYIEAATDTRGENAFTAYELTSAISSIKGVLGGITAFVMMVAAISLFVGGVGVMNIMLVSVTERTREIGIRKSLGARTSSIMWQFLIESGLISLTGGIIGIIIGYIFSILACTIAHAVKNSITMTPDFNILLILGIAVFSMGIGVFFGLYPAGKAAKMTPIDALRHK